MPDTPSHRLDPLFRPRSIALVGASARTGSVGHTTLRQLRHGRFPGTLHLVNPNAAEIDGLPCLPDLAAPRERPDLAVIAVGNPRVEAQVDASIALGIPAAVIFASLTLDGDPGLRSRIQDKAKQAGLLLLGANSMGYYAFGDRTWVCGFETRADHRPGGVALITQSGSVLVALLDCEDRIDYGFAVSTGQELGLTAADALDYALAQPETRVVGLFLEAVRDPALFVGSLERARERDIPVVALKVGRTAASARLAISHTGAIAGDDAAYQALFDRYGVARVGDLDAMAATLMLFAQPRRPGKGGLVSIHDSGGERGLMIDLAAQAGVPLAHLAPATVATLEATLDPGLAAENPLDAWDAGGPDADRKFAECLAAMMADPDAALGAVVCDRGPGSQIYPRYLDYIRHAAAASDKPMALVSNHQGSAGDPRAAEATRQGWPVLDGIVPFLEACRHMLAHRDFRERPPMRPPEPPAAAVLRWRARLSEVAPLDEAAALDLLADFGIPVVPHAVAKTVEGAIAAAERLGYPVALKTAMPGIAHKSDVGGVRLGLTDGEALRSAYADLSTDLGPRVLLASMVASGVEMTLGARPDPDFGPLVVIGAGGVLLELLRDSAVALAPFDAAEARRLIERLKAYRLLTGFRGAPPADLDAFCETAARFSAMVAALGPALAEIDVNPILVSRRGCVAVDALAIASARLKGDLAVRDRRTRVREPDAGSSVSPARPPPRPRCSKSDSGSAA